jgi:hypothetical protein
MTETRSLHRKLAQVMWEAERIPKNGRAPQAMGGFAFVQVGDAADFIRKALAEKVITMMPTAIRIVGQTDHATKAGGSMTTVDIVTDWTITDGESGESIVIQSFGAGADAGDKYSGKAQTNAMKYALLMGFLLSTGDDPELSEAAAAHPPAATASAAPLRTDIPKPPRAAPAARPAPPRLEPRPAPAAAAVPEEPEGLFLDDDARVLASAMALAAEQRTWKEGDKHNPAHKGLIRKARGLFCPTQLSDQSWCKWTERSA